jgi:hypothetical protein
MAERTYRQSLLQSFEICPRRTLHGLALDDDLTTGHMGSSADLGSAFHAVAAEILRTLYRQGEEQMPTQEAVEIMYEVYANGKWVLPTADRDTLRNLVLSLASYYRWNTRRIMALEERLETQIVCEDGIVRTLTGQPDVLLADPPAGMVIVDYKTGWSIPKTPRDLPEQGEAIVGEQYLSERGHFQLDIYGLLALRRYPQAKYVTLRELHLRNGQRREATLDRAKLEHVEREIADHMMKLDRAIDEGPDSELWRPRPGPQCARKCPVATSCPVPAEQRGVGALENEDLADAAAARFVVTDAVRGTLRDQLKTHYEQTGRPPEVGDGTGFFWRHKANGKGREFGCFPLSEHGLPDPSLDVDYTEALEASLAAVKAERGE